MALIELKNINFTYRQAKTPALKNINLAIEKGEFVGVIGPTGAGKSTLCWTIVGVVPQIMRGKLSGSVLVKDLPADKTPVARIAQIVGLVQQDAEAQLLMTDIEKEITFPLENLALPREEIGKRLNYVLDLVGLRENRLRHPFYLSGGQKQRVAVAAVLAMEPDVLILDEATSELDPVGAEEIHDLAGSLKKEGKTIVMVEHNIDELACHADRIVVMNQGEIVRDGPAREVLSEVEFARSPGHLPTPGNPGRLPPAEGAWCQIQAVPHKYRRGRRGFCIPEAVEMSDVILKTEGLCYCYSTRTDMALSNVNLSIHKGEFVAIIGQNGSGKTTLIKHFNGLLKPTKGKVIVEGRDTAQLPTSELARSVGYVFQNPDHQIFADTVKEEVDFGPKNLGFTEEHIEKARKLVLSEMELEGLEEEMPFQLSRGQRQRLAVASVLAMEPAILIIDEPTTGQDWKESIALMRLVKRLNDEGHTCIVTTHNMNLVSLFAKRVIVMWRSEVYLDSTTQEVFSQVDKILKAGIKPPEVYTLARKMMPDLVLDRPIDPHDLADYLAAARK